MPPFLLRSAGLIRDSVKEWLADGGPRLAAALAYYTGFSVPPLLLVIGGLVGLLSAEWGEDAVGQVVRLVPGGGGNAVAEWLQATGATPGRRAVASSVGFVITAIGAAGLFGQLQDALNIVWDCKHEVRRSVLIDFVMRRFVSMTMLVGTAFLLLVSLLLDTAMTFVLDRVVTFWPVLGALLTVAQLLFSILMATLVFALVFKVVPDAEVGWREAWVGGLFTSVLFNLGQEALAWYLANNANLSLYGAFTAVIVFFMWVYYSAQILLLGAEFTKVYGRTAPGREKRRPEGAIRTREALPPRGARPATR